MNAKALAISGVLLVVLAVCLGVALFLANQKSSADNEHNSSNTNSTQSPTGISEWFASVKVSDDFSEYYASVYSHISLNNETGTIDEWELEMQVDYTSENVPFRHQYFNRQFIAYQANGNTWEAAACQEYDNLPVDKWKDTYQVEQVSIDKDVSAAAGATPYIQSLQTCPDCTVWRIHMNQQSFLLMLSPLGTPLAVFGDYGYRAEVLEFRTDGSRVTFDPNPYEALLSSGLNCTTPVEASSLDTDPGCEFKLDSALNPCRASVCSNITSQEGAEQAECEAYIAQYCEVHFGDPGCHKLFQARYEGSSSESPASRRALSDTCPASWIGDGYCDSCLNNAAGTYDGGDCCPGTCTPGRANPCGVAGYACVDPHAENCVAGQPLGSPSACKKCLFLHGLGNALGVTPNMSRPCTATCVSEVQLNDTTCHCLWYSDQSDSTNTMELVKRGFYTVDNTSYWGSIGQNLVGKCEPVYNSINTVHYGWDDATLQQAYYTAAKHVYDHGGVVYAHSMGNLILAGACKDQGLCGVKWYMVQGPLRGSKVADLGDINKGICLGWRTSNGTCSGVEFMSGRVGDLLGTTGNSYTYGLECGKYHDGVRSCTTNHTGEALSKFIADKGLLLGGMCGVSGWGAGGVWGAQLWAINQFVYGIYSSADGAVGLEECLYYKTGENCYEQCDADPYGYEECYTVCDPILVEHPNLYKYNGNHFDGTGFSGNFNQIVDWYKSKF